MDKDHSVLTVFVLLFLIGVPSFIVYKSGQIKARNKEVKRILAEVDSFLKKQPLITPAELAKLEAFHNKNSKNEEAFKKAMKGLEKRKEDTLQAYKKISKKLQASEKKFPHSRDIRKKIAKIVQKMTLLTGNKDQKK